MSGKSPGAAKAMKQHLYSVLMLDDTSEAFQLDAKSTGHDLINLVYANLKLIESDYFGLEIVDSKGKKTWLDYDKAVSKQMTPSSRLIFCVKFYTPDPGQLEEEYTRYLYALQIKRDLAEGSLLCSDATASLLVSYILQAEMGDYVEAYGNSPSYFNDKHYFPHQNEGHEMKIMDYHKNHVGQPPAHADTNLLDIARKVELYGILMHPAKDHEGVQLNLAVAHLGILVFQNFTKINTFSWAKIRKLSFKRKKFLIKLHPEGYGFYKDTVEFYFAERDDSKNFWKKCIENHSFFRCISTKRMPRQKSKLLTRGSSFRYYGRTQKELIENTRENFSKNRSFERSYSMRSISHLGARHFNDDDDSGGGSGGGGSAALLQMNGTQSLNRNLASRATGANIVPLLNNGAIMNGGGGGSSDSSFVPRQTTSPSGAKEPKGRILAVNQHTGSLSSLNNFTNQQVNFNPQPQFRNGNVISPQQQQQQQRSSRKKFDNDSSTRGSRTIDSRYSGHDKTLGLSDDDDEDEDEEEEEEDEDVDDEEEEEEDVDDEEVDDEDEDVDAGSYEEKSRRPRAAFYQNGHTASPAAAQNGHYEDDHCTCGAQHDDQPPVVVNTNVTSFKSAERKPKHKPSSSSSRHHQPAIVHLPIQKSSEPLLHPHSHTGLLTTATNPNKIYSRKEVITTYKEETKNTQCTEEFEETTTFYDTPAAVVNGKPHLAVKSANAAAAPSSSFKSSSSPSQSTKLKPPRGGTIGSAGSGGSGSDSLPRGHGHHVTTTTVKNHNTVHRIVDNTTTTEAMTTLPTNHDDEASKNDRCSLAAKILYNNIQYPNSNHKPPPINGMASASTATFERLKRPSSLIKPLIVATPSQTAPKPSYNNGRSEMNDEVDDTFPPPPPIPNNTNGQFTSNSSYTTYSYSNHQRPQQPAPTILQDYQDPMQYNLHSKMAHDTASNKCVLPIHNNSKQTYNIEEEFKRKKNSSMDDAYCIVKELVMTERTYKKDLELVTHTFRHFAVTNNFDLSELGLFDQLIYAPSLEPISEFHGQFLRDLEARLLAWTDKTAQNQKIGDLLLHLNRILKNYRHLIEKFEEILVEMELACKKNKRFDCLFKDFESQKVCYLPFTTFLIKPIQRLIHYKLLFERLLIFYGVKHPDYQETYQIFDNIEKINDLINEKLPAIENKQKLMELQRDLLGIDNMLAPGKINQVFIREGSLQKLSRKGYQQRMFFLFNNILLYCARSSSQMLQFKVHGEYQLRNLQIEDGNSHINIPNSFTIYSSNRSILVSAVSPEEKSKWLQDLYEAIEKVRNSGDDRHNYPSLKSNSSSDTNLDNITSNDDTMADQSEQPSSSQALGTTNSTSSAGYQQQRANTTMHVCWYRNTSVSAADAHRSLVNQLSGFLLRKFKNSNGWQKLWVVFTNFCLFFYKTHQDEFPLASLPLLGYTIAIPAESDNINKDYVFKLQFKNHVYFFRAESQYSYDRWLEVIQSAAQRPCLLNSDD